MIIQHSIGAAGYAHEYAGLGYAVSWASARGGFIRTLTAAIGLNISGTHSHVVAAVFQDRAVASVGTDRVVEDLY